MTGGRKMDRRRVQQLVLFVLIVVLLALRHLAIFYSVAEFPHFPQLVNAFKHLDSLDPWVQGSAVWETRLQLGGPLFYWLNYPVRLFQDPVVGIHLYYFLLELSVICLWLVWGPRTGGLTSELSWAGGFFLAVAFNSKIIVCENMTMAVYLAVVLFLAFIWAMGKEGYKPMALVGLLLGMAVQVHISALVLAPPLLLVLWLERRLFARRVLALVVAWLVVVLICAKGISLDQQHGSYALTQLLSRFSWGNLASRLFLSWGFPLTLLGLWLGIYTWYKDGTRTVGLRLTIFWLAIPYVLLSVALAYMGGYQAHESRYAMLNPARALLAGMGLTWLVARANPWLQRTFSRKVEVLDLLIGAGLVLVVVNSVDARRHWEAFEQRHAARLSRACNCDFWQYRDLSRHWQKFYRAVSRRGLPEQLAGSEVEANSPNREETEALIYWMRGRETRNTERKTMARTNYLVVTPKLANFDLSRVEGAKDYGSFFIIPNCQPAEVKELSPGRFSVVPGHGAPRDRPLLATVVGRDKFVIPKRLALEVGGQPRPPTSGCHCTDPTDFYSYGGWMVFDAGTAEQAAGETSRLVVDFEVGELDKVQVFTLPPLTR